MDENEKKLYICDGNEASLYEPVEPWSQATKEAVLAAYNDPEQPELSARVANLLDLWAEGGTFAAFKPEPEAEGMFAGYHEFRVWYLQRTDDGLTVVRRILYATPEQTESMKFIIPDEGLFVLDPPESDDDL